MNQRKKSLKILSQREKLQLIELQKARDKILLELRKFQSYTEVSPINCKSDWNESMDDISFFSGGALSNKNSLRGNHRTKNSSTQSYKSHIDMIPILANTGELAMEVGLGSNRKGKLKLPIFKLPPVEEKQIKSILYEKSINKINSKFNFLLYHNFDGMQQTFITMIRDLSSQEIEFVNKHLLVTLNDIKDIENELKRKNEKNKSAFRDFNDSNSGRSMLDFFIIDQNKNLFTKSKEIISGVHDVASSSTHFYLENKEENTEYSAIKELSNTLPMSGFSRSNMPTTSVVDIANIRLQAISTLGYSSFALPENNPCISNLSSTNLFVKTNNFLNDASLNENEFTKKRGQNRVSFSAKSLETTVEKFQFPAISPKNQKTASNRNDNSSVSLFTKRTNQNSKRTTKTNTTKNSVASSASDKLTSDLIKSLNAMEQHAAMVKKKMASVQDFIKIDNPRAKTLLYSVASEKMKKAIYKLILLDLKRGWIAWTLHVKQVRREEKMIVFTTFLVYRNTALGLAKVVYKYLKFKLQIWKEFTYKEVRRLRRVRVESAIVQIQAMARGFFARRRVIALKQRKKYQKLYDSVLLLQAVFRGCLTRWRFAKQLRDAKEKTAATFIQRIYLGFKARKRVKMLRFRKNKEQAATIIQKMARSVIARILVADLRYVRKCNKSAVKLQAVIRSFLVRRNIALVLIEKARFKHVSRIQAMVRGALSRMNHARKLAEIAEYKKIRNDAATKIQSCYRGYRSRLIYRMMIFNARKKSQIESNAMTKINRMVRGFLSRCFLKRLFKERYQQWIVDARNTQEIWSDNAAAWYYFNATTAETTWEPGKEGYTKFDGKLVLFSGEVIEDPINDVEAVDDDENNEKNNVNNLCSECTERVAIRDCHECGDKFCTKCYKATHATGSRRNHTYAEIGPIDCSECEAAIAERWCVSCDEAFCDFCWRKVHARRKRVFHPFSVVAFDGTIDAKIQTIDGVQLSGYDSSYAQQRLEQQQDEQFVVQQLQKNDANNAAEQAYGFVSPNEVEVEEWSMYNDDQGYEYWYNNYSGVSQYENPFSLVAV